MAAGTVSYQQPSYGSLAGAVGEKIGSAINMAATSRKRREDEIKKLQETPNKTDEEELRLSDLLEEKQNRKRGSLFGKALGAEFGGDRMRRTMGFFQTSPEDKNDPALTKAQRFEASLAAPPKQGVYQQELDLGGAGYKEQNALEKLTSSIALKFKEIGAKIEGLRRQEESDPTPTVVVKLAENVNGLKSYFTKNNKIQEESNSISNDQLTEQIKARDRAQADAIEVSGEARNRQAGKVGFDNERERGKGIMGILGDALGGLGNLLGGRRGFGRRGGGKNRMPRMSSGRMYSNPIGPQPMGSSTPWARARGGAGINGFAPRMPSRVMPRKFASGGILDNPTDITGAGDQAVIPKANLTNAVQTNPENQKKATPFAKAMMLPTVAAGSLLLSTITNVVKNMGGLSRMFMPIIGKFLAPAATAFGLPGGLIAGMLLGGAPAQAHPGPEAHGPDGKPQTQNNVKSRTGGGAMGFMAPGMVTGGGSVDGYGITSGFGLRASPGGVGSTNHLGVDYGTPQGTPLSTKRAGKVANVTMPAMGNNGEVHVIHDDGTEARYLHLSKVAVSKGMQVVPGTLLGETGGQVGTPGAGPSTGPHLHFEYYPSAGSGPVDGSGVASSIFSVGGQVTTTGANPLATSATPVADTPVSETPVTPGGTAPPMVLDFSNGKFNLVPAPPVQDTTVSPFSITNLESPNSLAPSF